ncbi:ribosome biogenesis protein YTM1 [Paragonimus westermani]|uniref:Ribosome biogenesis protein YTM1 n=1 Tax=Paragonimus westermani TaxID=34504 RepID=A0A5J4N915_9TREM|nr:ribosome biogenesis protein YTM1 [Paragonimus westermani]
MEHHVQVTLVTKSERFSVSSSPISLPLSSSSTELEKLLWDLLEESSGSPPKVEFIFLIAGEFLTTSIGEHLTGRQIVSESLEIEYCVKQQAPTYVAGIDQEDLISSVKRYKDYVLTGSYDGTVQIWTAETPKQLQSIQLEDRVKCVEWLTVDSDQATFATGGFDQTAQIWVWNIKTNTTTCAAVCRGHSETVMTIAAQPVSAVGVDSQLFASGSWDGTIKLWSASAKETDLSEETGGIVHTRKSTNKIPTRIPRVTMAGHRETVTRVCWLPVSSSYTSNTDRPSGSAVHSQLLSVSWDHTLRVWECQSGAGSELRSIVSSHAIHDADAALQGILTASSDNRVRIYDLRAREALALIGFHGHTAWLTSVAWAPHRDNQFVTGSIDRSVRLWDTRNTRASLYDLMGHTDMVTDVDWAAPIHTGTGKAEDARHYILSSSADGSVKIYRYPE